jgi:hypothetical protein
MSSEYLENVSELSRQYFCSLLSKLNRHALLSGGDVENPTGTEPLTVSVFTIFVMWLSMSEMGQRSALLIIVDVTRSASMLLKKLVMSV